MPASSTPWNSPPARVGKPLRVEIAGFARPQLDERAIDLGLQITRGSVASGSQRRFALGTQPQSRGHSSKK